jgi:hypothetical protein
MVARYLSKQEPAEEDSRRQETLVADYHSD